MPYRRASIALLALLLSASLSLATDRYYVGPNNGLWSDPNNWSLTQNGPGGAGPPASGDKAYVQSTTSKKVIVDNTGAVAETIFLKNVTLDESVGGVSYHGANLTADSGQSTRWDHSAGYNDARSGFGLSLIAATGGSSTYAIGGTAELSFWSISVGANSSLLQSGGKLTGINTISIYSGGVYSISSGLGGGDGINVDGGI